MSPTDATPPSQDDKSFLCHAATRKKSELSFVDRFLDVSTMKLASACPVNVDTNMAFGARSYNCGASSQAWKPPPFMSGPTHEERMSHAAGGASCARGK